MDTRQTLKPPDEWKTDQAISAAHKAYLETLRTEGDEEVDAEKLTKADASKLIDALQSRRVAGNERVDTPFILLYLRSTLDRSDYADSPADGAG